MKYLLLLTCITLSINSHSQNKTNRFGVTGGAFIQQYNGALGNSFFQFKTTCFAGVTGSFSYHLNKYFDARFTGTIGRYGYCQTESDANRFVSYELRCPGCTDRFGMGELRSQMISGNLDINYKLANGFIIPENSRIAPYIFAGVGLNHLYDIMKRNCVNEGFHFSLNGGAGIKYHFTDQWSAGYQLAFGCFTSSNAYLVNEADVKAIETTNHEDDEFIHDLEHRKDLYMQNTLFIGFSF